MAKKNYGNESITALKGADRVRKRPGVIFGSDGIEGCEHSVFEIISNSIDEAKEGYGKVIEVTRFTDNSVEVKDYGRGIPLDWNPKEEKYNWELVFCELYAGGKYDNNSSGGNYEYSLGLNGLGACATQYSSEYMKVWSYKTNSVSSIEFKKGENATELKTEKLTPSSPHYNTTGTVIRWKPDAEVFNDIAIPPEYFYDTLHRQAVVNSGITFELRIEQKDGSFKTESFLYEKQRQIPEK